MATLIDPAADAVDRADLIEALLHHNATARRCPRHWVARLDALHGKMNQLLDELEAMDRGQANQHSRTAG